MKVGKVVHRAGIEPTLLTFWVSVLPLHHVGSLMSPLYPQQPVYADPCLIGQCRQLNSSPRNWKYFIVYNNIHTGNDFTFIHTQGRFNNHTMHSRIMVRAINVMGVTKMENTVPRAGLKPTSLPFRASVLGLHQDVFLTSMLYPHPAVYAAPCLRDQCKLL